MVKDAARPDRWSEQTVGRDRVVLCNDGEITMVFALGPPRGAAKDPTRLESIAEDRGLSLRHCRQVHGRTIHSIGGGGCSVAEVGAGDGLITTAIGTGLLVWTADCVPVLLGAGGVIAAIHAGWRGCAADIVGCTVGVFERRHRVSPENLRVALGPAVCGPCYEVGPEVPEALRSYGLDRDRWLAEDHVDLRGFLAARLEGLGVPTEKIETIGGCTVESPDLASFRRDHETAGRQWSLVYLNG